MEKLHTIKLPIEGMTCDGCARNVKQALQNLPGVSQVTVDLATKKAGIEYDGRQVDLIDFEQAVSEAGYSVPTRMVVLNVDGMSCMSCISHVNGALTDMNGVLGAAVELSQGQVNVTYVPDLVSISEMESAVNKTGYHAAAAVEQADETPGAREKSKSANGEDNRVFKAGWIGRVIKRS
jgi:P-type Cu+ transporter